MTNSNADSSVAVVGMACRLPGADNLDQFWNMVRRGRSACGPAPDARFNRRLYYHPTPGVLNKSYSDLAALVNYRPIDCNVCPIPEALVASYDLAHVTLCEVAATACRQAGYDPASMPYANTGVYVGHAAASGVSSELTYATYIAATAKYLREAAGFDQLADGLGEQVIQEMIEDVRRTKPHHNADGGPFFGASLAAGLISKTFGLNGPYMSFNAACASSSRALVQAVRALQLGAIDMALVGGASCFHSDTLVLFSQSRSLTAKGSHPFSAEADGLVVGEGYVVLVLKMLDRAVADNDQILAVLPGVGVSSDGRGKSLWAPRKEGQILAIKRAYGPRVSMTPLQYIEAHATSTALGDVTEITALTTALQGQLPPGKKLAISSAKLNVGHTLEVAGLVGVIRAVLALQHDTIPPAIDDRPLNPEVDWDHIPFYAPRQAVAWPKNADGVPRRAGVDAFGIGGLNVHIVIDDYMKPAAPMIASPGVPSQAVEQDAVAIIGMGAVFPGALTLDAYWDLLQSGRDPKTDVTADRWDEAAFFSDGVRGLEWKTPGKRGGFVVGFNYDWRKHKIPPKQITQASPLQFMILDAVDQALQNAKYNERPFDRERVGVVVGTIFGGDYAAELAVDLRLPEFQETLATLLRRRGVPEPRIAAMAESYGNILLEHMPALLDETGSFTASALSSRITKSFDLMGGAVAVDAGEASSLAALSCCVDQLRGGDCEMMICVGAHHDMTPLLYEDWAFNGRLALGEARSPFDVRADGGFPGEGCGVLLLKRLADARRDNDPIVGIIRGIGAATDFSRSDATKMAVGRAIANAKLTAADVAVIETTSTGKADADAAEWLGFADAYRSRMRTQPVLLGTAASQIGDAGGAAGMASLVKVALEIERLEVPGNVGLEHPSPNLTRHADVLKASATASPMAANSDGRVVAGVHIGGENEAVYHVLIERGTKIPVTRKAVQPMELPNLKPTHTETKMHPNIIHFDATTRRRERLRQKGIAPAPQPMAAKIPSLNGNGHSHSPVEEIPKAVGAAVAPSPAARPVIAVRPVVAVKPSLAVQPVIAAKPVVAVQPAVAPVAEESSSLNPKELEAFLVNFVVEHTGYPAEVVELDADLEADLGIDSIKKAQLFGELGEYFDVRPSEDLSLDSFPTLRHVLDFLVKSQGVSPVAPIPVAVAQPVVAPQPVVAVQPAVAPAAQESPSLNPAELETFLVNFVVEHTGYPAEVVELDADLEADLGIDSIKKAQLFGELGEYFDIRPSEDLSLDSFPTLRHVLDFLVKSQS